MSNTLHARLLSHGQSEIWLGDDGPRRTIATSALLLAIASLFDHQTFAAFYVTLHAEIGNVAAVVDAGEVVQDLGLAECTFRECPARALASTFSRPFLA